MFKSHPFLEDLEIDTQPNGILLRKVFTHKKLESTKGVIYLPYLKLFGIMYCAATPKMRAEAFYRVLNDKELEEDGQ